MLSGLYAIQHHSLHSSSSCSASPPPQYTPSPWFKYLFGHHMEKINNMHGLPRLRGFSKPVIISLGLSANLRNLTFPCNSLLIHHADDCLLCSPDFNSLFITSFFLPATDRFLKTQHNYSAVSRSSARACYLLWRDNSLSPECNNTIINSPFPETKKQLWGFLGLVV